MRDSGSRPSAAWGSWVNTTTSQWPLAGAVLLLAGLTYAFRPQPVPVEIAPVKRGPLSVTVEDDGIGIPPAHLGRVFDPFFTTKLGKGGSGVGLSLVYRIATSVLGGVITVKSEPGRGTIFTLRIPANAPEPA